MKRSFRHGSIRHVEGQISLVETHDAGQLSLPAVGGGLSLETNDAIVTADTEVEEDAYEVVDN